MKCAWCGSDIEQKDIDNANYFTYTHDDKSVETTHKGDCDKEYDNSRGLN